MGRGVTVANRFLVYRVDFSRVVLQHAPISIRLFPGTSEPLQNHLERSRASSGLASKNRQRPATERVMEAMS